MNKKLPNSPYNKQTLFQILKSFRWLKEIDIFEQPVDTLRLRRKKLMHKDEFNSNRFIGSVYGGFITILFVIVLITYFIQNFQEMLTGIQDVSKKL